MILGRAWGVGSVAFMDVCWGLDLVLGLVGIGIVIAGELIQAENTCISDILAVPVTLHVSTVWRGEGDGVVVVGGLRVRVPQHIAPHYFPPASALWTLKCSTATSTSHRKLATTKTKHHKTPSRRRDCTS